jgi:hypothetical protein
MQIRRGYSLLRATHQLELLAQLHPGSRTMATTRGSRYSRDQEASATVQLAHRLAPDHDAAVLEFALATSLHHDGITGAVWYAVFNATVCTVMRLVTIKGDKARVLLACPLPLVQRTVVDASCLQAIANICVSTCLLLLCCGSAGTQKLLVAKDYEHWIHMGMVKAAPKFLQGLQQLLYPSAGISTMAVRAPDISSSGNASGSSAKYEEAKAAAAEMRIGSIFKRRLAQLDTAEETAVTVISEIEDEAAVAERPHETAAAQEDDKEQEQEGKKQQQEGGEQDYAEAAASAPADSSSSSSNRLPLLSMCLNLNASLCSSSVSLSNTNNGGFLMVVYNPLSWSYNWGVRIPVEDGQYAVTGPDAKPVQSQVVPLPDGVQLVWPNSKAAAGGSKKPTAELAVMVSAPPLGHAVYKVVRLSEEAVVSDSVTNTAVAGVNEFAVMKQRSLQESSADSDIIQLFKNGSDRNINQQPMVLSNGKIQLTVGPAGISSVKTGSRTMNFSAALIKYQNSFAGSGAYTFKADGTPHAPPPSEVNVIKGPILQEIRQRFYDMPGVLTTRLWAGQSHLGMDWTAGPAGRVDWEVFVRYSTTIKSQGLWFTDANGREYQQRRRQYRPSFDLPASSEQLAGNIYPITTGAFLHDDESAMHVAVDRAQGVVSLVDGQMDVHLHRTSASDDGKGMQEALIDGNAASGTHIVSFGLPEGDATNADSLLRTTRHLEQVGTAVDQRHGVLFAEQLIVRYNAAWLQVLQHRTDKMRRTNLAPLHLLVSCKHIT